MVKFLDKKSAFSLVEALVVMTIAAIFVAVIANVIPHKAKPRINAEAHGGFECYWKDDKVYSRVIKVGNEEATEKEESGDFCVFRTTQYIPYIIINAVGGGAMGSSDNGGAAGRFQSAYFPLPQPSYKLYPGKGGTAEHTSGYPSKVVVGAEEILEVNGGNDAITAKDSTFSDIIDVYAVKGMGPEVVHYGCDYTPRAWLDQSDKRIHISFCKDGAPNIIEEKLEFSNSDYTTDNQKYKTVINSPVVDDANAKVLSKLKDGTINTWEYYDVGALRDAKINPLSLPDSCNYTKITAMNNPMCPSRYKLEIKLNIPDNGEDGAVSSLTKYANLMHYNKLEELKPGNGGPKNNGNGRAGAILISW